MRNKFLSVLLLLFSINSFSQSTQNREQIGSTFAECAAYSMHANIWFVKLNDKKNADQWQENMENSARTAIRLIGDSKTLEITISTSKRIGTLQSNPEAYITEIHKGVKHCDAYAKNNLSNVKALMK